MPMKPRVIAPYKVLAVALATVSCGKATSEEPRAQGAASATTPTAPVAAAASAAPAPATVPDDKADPKLLLLRAELDTETRESALAKQTHYRPLCDKDGYPLVGNVLRKGPGGPQPSELCTEVRAKSAKPS
jgi:hypothetical protein